ncbi:Uncharacterized hydrolase YugF [Linum perenne]
MLLTTAATATVATPIAAKFHPSRRFTVSAEKFPSFLPNQIENIKDKSARNLASRIQRLPVAVGDSGDCVMSSCVKPLSSIQSNATPLVLLHGFDSSCLEWRYTFPQLEAAGLEAWAVDVLGWGFSDLEKLPPCNVQTKREHLYQLWKSHIRRPVILVGPSLGAAIAIDFAAHYPEAVEKLVLIDASVYAEGTGDLAKLPRMVAYAGVRTYYLKLIDYLPSICYNIKHGVMYQVSLLKSVPLRLFVNIIAFNGLPFDTSIDWMKIGRLHCMYSWWGDATVDFMISGGYNVASLIPKVNQKTLIIWGEDDKIISSKLGVRLHCELPNAVIRQIPNCGHIPHVEKPESVAKLIEEFIQEDSPRVAELASQL